MVMRTVITVSLVAVRRLFFFRSVGWKSGLSPPPFLSSLFGYALYSITKIRSSSCRREENEQLQSYCCTAEIVNSKFRPRMFPRKCTNSFESIKESWKRLPRVLFAANWTPNWHSRMKIKRLFSTNVIIYNWCRWTRETETRRGID